MNWFNKVVSAGEDNDKDLHMALDAAEYYTNSYNDIKKYLHREGSKIVTVSAQIAGNAEECYAKLQELDSIIEYLEMRERAMKVKMTKNYMEHYQRALTESAAKNYAESSDEVQKIQIILQQVAFVRNLYLGVSKGIEYLHFQIGNITKMRSAGIEDATL